MKLIGHLGEHGEEPAGGRGLEGGRGLILILLLQLARQFPINAQPLAAFGNSSCPTGPRIGPLFVLGGIRPAGNDVRMIAVPTPPSVKAMITTITRRGLPRWRRHLASYVTSVDDPPPVLQQPIPARSAPTASTSPTVDDESLGRSALLMSTSEQVHIRLLNDTNGRP